MSARPLLSYLALIVLSVLASLPACAETKPQLVWTIHNIPPFTIVEGPLKNQGIGDQMLALLTADLPQYEHVYSVGNRARTIQKLSSGTLTCDPGLLWSKEGEQISYFSVPTHGILSSGVVVRKQDEHELAAFIQQAEFDLAAFLADGRFNLGIQIGRSYGEVIDAKLARAKPNTLVAHYGTNPTLSLLRMQQRQTLTALLSLSPELRYHGENAGVPLDTLSVYPVKGVPKYQLVYISCSKNPEGLAAIKAINASLRHLREGQLAGLYTQWLDSASRETYLKAAKDFLNEPNSAAARSK
jgi:uncharacterized protein (TIGR02285 family)